MFTILFHEFGGHKKISYNRNLDDESSSPKKIINENNKLIELKRVSSYKDDDNEYILSSENSEEGEGESGKYLELCFGKHDKELITSLLIYIDNKGKLLNRADLFAGKNFDVLQKYIILKNEIKDKNIKINLAENLTIEEEIDELERIIKNSNIKKSTENFKPQKKILKVIGKKRRREKDISDDKQQNKTSKNKDKHMKINIILDKTKKDELNLKEENKKEKELKEKKKSKKKQETDDSNVVDYNNTEEYFNHLKKQIREKYGFKTRVEMIKGIKQIINSENSLSIQETCDLHLVLRFLYEKA